ncbi:MAG TPA: GatB/YqeY domain-containing protein [Anaerolineales bacterium]
MDIKEKLTDAMRQAMKANDDVTRRTTRMVLAAIKLAEVDKQSAIDDAAVMSLVQKEIKNRREAIEEARKANRSDLIADNEAEIKVLEAYLPKAMSPDELRSVIQAAIEEAGASGPTDMGKVMKLVLPRLGGRAAGDQVSAMVKEMLTK